MGKDRHYPDDDGRTIADMSDVQRPSLLRVRKSAPSPEKPEADADCPWENHSISKEERSWVILGALKAALLIALAFILGLGAVILLLTLLL